MDEVVTTVVVDEVKTVEPAKKKRGRPKGSKNKPKVAVTPVVETVVTEPAVADNGF